MDRHAVQTGQGAVPVVQQQRQFRAAQDDRLDPLLRLHPADDPVDLRQRTFFDDANLHEAARKDKDLMKKLVDRFYDC